MSKVTTTPNVTPLQNLERSAYTALASGAALLLADGAAKGWTHISVGDWKTVGVSVAAGVLTAAKNVVTNYLSTHQSLRSQLEALQAQVEEAGRAQAQVPQAPPVLPGA